MSSTKIFVIRLREVLKYGFFIIAGVVLAGILIYFFLPKEMEQDPNSAMYTPGKYSCAIILNESPISVEVTVDEQEIVSIDLLNMDDSQAVFYPLVQPTLISIAEQVVKTQSLEVSLSKESEYTGSLLLNAIESALSKARLE